LFKEEQNILKKDRDQLMEFICQKKTSELKEGFPEKLKVKIVNHLEAVVSFF